MDSKDFFSKEDNTNDGKCLEEEERRRFKEVIPYIDEAFDIMYPKNIKEFLLYILNRMIKIIYGLK